MLGNAWFLSLWSGSLQEVFHKHDSNQSGYLNRIQLRAAMRDAGRQAEPCCGACSRGGEGRGCVTASLPK